MSDSAWVTLATNDTYSLGALVLAHSLRAVGTKHHLAILVTPGVTSPMRANLSTVFNTVQEVDILDSKDEANLYLLKRPELGITFTKLHCWKLTQFKKCVFLDADTMVLQNCDELFDRDEFSAAPDVGWPDCFNSGVFVYCPSSDTYAKLIKFALEKGSFDGGDQGLLNSYFSDWAHKDINKHLPFIYNMCSTAAYSYLPAFMQFGLNAKIVHFIGNTKPWQQHFDLKNKRVHPSPDLRHLSDVLQKWWDLFCSFIHPQLNKEMAENVMHHHITWQSSSICETLNFEVYNEVQCSDNTNVGVNLPFRKFVDPWEQYDENVNNKNIIEHCQPILKEDNCSLQNLNDKNAIDESNNRLRHNISDSFSEPNTINPIHFHSTSIVNIEQTDSTPASDAYISNNSNENNSQSPHIISNTNFNDIIVPDVDDEQSTCSSHISHENLNVINEINIPGEHIQNTSCTSNNSTLLNWNLRQTDLSLTKVIETASISTEIEANSNVDAGLAGLFAQCTLGADGQSALEDHIHRQSWEVGNIDYLGRDSFDNIWSKICQTLGEDPVKKETTTTTTEAKQEEVKQETEQKTEPKAESKEPPSEAPKVEAPISDVPKDVPVEAAAKPPTEASAVPIPTPDASKTETTPTEAPKLAAESQPSLIQETVPAPVDAPKAVEAIKPEGDVVKSEPSVTTQTDKPVESAVPSDVCSKPADVCSKPADVCSKPADVCSKPTDVCSKPAEVCSKPAEVCSKPTEGSTPTDVCSKQDEVCNKPTDVCSKPDEVCSKPTEVCSKTGEVCSKPSDVCCKQSEPAKDAPTSVPTETAPQPVQTSEQKAVETPETQAVPKEIPLPVQTETKEPDVASQQQTETPVSKDGQQTITEAPTSLATILQQTESPVTKPAEVAPTSKSAEAVPISKPAEVAPDSKPAEVSAITPTTDAAAPKSSEIAASTPTAVADVQTPQVPEAKSPEIATPQPTEIPPPVQLSTETKVPKEGEQPAEKPVSTPTDKSTPQTTEAPSTKSAETSAVTTVAETTTPVPSTDSSATPTPGPESATAAAVTEAVKQPAVATPATETSKETEKKEPEKEQASKKEGECKKADSGAKAKSDAKASDSKDTGKKQETSKGESKKEGPTPPPRKSGGDGKKKGKK